MSSARGLLQGNVMEELPNLADFEAAALARLPAGIRDHYRGGANDEVALRENRAAWERWQLHFRVLRDVATVDRSLVARRGERPLAAGGGLR